MPVEMTENDKKKAFLRRYRECERREQEILEEIQRLRMDKMFPSVVNDGMPKGSQQSDLSDYVAAIERQIGRLKRERLEKARTRDQIDLAIRRMENPNEQRVLRLRYLWGLGWEAIGEKMGYSREGAIKLHGRALPNLKFLKEYTPVHSNL